MNLLKFKHVHQGNDTKSCGQACVASILGISLDEAVSLIGHSGGTTTKEIVNALGIEGKRVRGKPKIPSLLCVLWMTGNSHWVLYEGDVVMDPSLRWKVDFEFWHKSLKKTGSQIISYLDLSKYYQENFYE